MENNKIKVERETFESNGKEYFSYFIKGNVRGRDIKAGVIPPDKGGYTVLDIVFDGQMEAKLIVTPFEIKDVKGKTIKGNTYSVRSYDEDGTVYECPIKPARTSDKSFLSRVCKESRNIRRILSIRA